MKEEKKNTEQTEGEPSIDEDKEKSDDEYLESVEYKIIVERSTRTTRHYLRRRLFTHRSENTITSRTIQAEILILLKF